MTTGALMPSNEETQRLQDVSRGLLYPSESDEPFEAFQWPPHDSKTVREEIAAHSDKGVQQIEEISIEDFFAELAETDEADRYDELRRVLETELVAPKVFRIGSIRIDVFLIGRTQSGNWAGLRTVSVET